MKVIPNVTITDNGFTRSTVGTYVNVSGVLSTAAINAVRLNFDPITHAPLGMLIETAATNLMTYSEQLDNAAYVPTGATIGVNAVASPDGTTTADKFIEGATATHYLKRSGVTVNAYASYTQSLFIKAAGRTLLNFTFSNTAETNGVEYTFDLTAGTVSGATLIGTASQYNAGIQNYGNGWYRIFVTAIVDTFSTTIGFKLTPSNGSTTSYTGDGSSGFYLWGFQLETGTAPTSYIATTTAAVSRGADVLTSGTFGSSTINEPDATVGEVVWNAATAYVAGNVVILTSTHRKYTRLIPGTTATSPHLDATNWADSGATNRWALFDLNRNAKTVTAGPLVIVVAPGKRIDSIGLVGLTANTVRIQVMVGNTSFYDQTIKTLLRNTLTWSQYLLGSFRYAPTVVQFNIPPVSNCTVIITLEGTTVKCAGLVMGTGIYLGRGQYTATNSALNFSKVDRDAYGNATLVARRSVPKVDIKTELDRKYVDSVRDVRTDLNAVVAMWSGLDDLTTEDYFESLLIVGIYKEFSISLDYVDQASVTLQVEEI